MSQETEPRRVKSVGTACEIIEHLKASNGCTVTEVADSIGLSPGAAHTHLATLKDHGYVVQDGLTYRLGPYFLTLGEYIRNNNQLYQSAKDEVERVAETTGEGAHLIVEHDGRVLVLYEVFGENAVGVEYHARKREESLRQLHCTASGKALLSELPRERVDSIINEHGMEARTENTITDRTELFEELERIEEQGFAISDEEQMIGLRAVGAPIMRTDGAVAGAISISGPASRLQGHRFHEDLAEDVMHVANVVEVNLNAERGVQ